MIAGVMVIAAIVVIYILATVLGEGAKVMLLDMRSVSDSPLTIQNVMWIMFFLGFGELINRYLISKEVESGLNKKYLPEDDTSVLEFGDMPKIFKNVKDDAEVEGSLAQMTKKLVMQFQTSHSIDQTHQMLNSQMEMNSTANDLNYNMIRYITWLIPTLGFIGTVLGIMLGLDYAATNNPEAPTFLGEVTAKLAVAFYTTLVALVMSAILVFLTHIIQGREESLSVRIAQYCLDNFINRLYVSKDEE
jgi:biopolymer transport protein ExbB/TolQ